MDVHFVDFFCKLSHHLRKISSCTFTYILAFFSDDQFLDTVHEYFFKKGKMDFLKLRVYRILKRFTNPFFCNESTVLNFSFVGLQACKGQVISKCFYGVIVSIKKPTKNF